MLRKLFALLLFGVLLIGSVAAAQVIDQNENELEITGVVEAVDDGTITIGGLVIDISGAEINDPIAVGALVKVHVTVADDGGFIAREAELAEGNAPGGADDIPAPAATEEPGDDNGVDSNDNNDDNGDGRREGEFEIVGTIDDIGDGFIVMNGQTIQIDTAEVKNDLVVGGLVKIHLSNNDGVLVAREVEDAVDDDNNDDRNDDRWDVTYTIRSGDTLSDIAQRAGTTVEEIARMNNIADIRLVVAGTTLILPNEPFDDSHSGSDDRGGDDNDDNSGPGSHDDDEHGDDNSGSGSHDNDDDHGGNSGRGGHDDNGDDHSGSGSHDNDDD